MAEQQIVTYGDPVLVTPAEEIKRIDQEVQEMAEEMYHTMIKANGVGLAAPQIGESRQFCVIAYSDGGQEYRIALINPRITGFFGPEEPFEEGCLSFPGLSATVLRPAGVSIEARDIHGELINIRSDGLLARILQHEIDHLQGKVFVDHLEEPEYRRIEPSLHRLERQYARKSARSKRRHRA